MVPRPEKRTRDSVHNIQDRREIYEGWISKKDVPDFEVYVYTNQMRSYDLFQFPRKDLIE